MSENNENNQQNRKKSLMETVRTERGFRDHFDSIGTLAHKVLGGKQTPQQQQRQQEGDHEGGASEGTGTGTATSPSSSSSKGALIVGVFAFGAIGTAATMYYRVKASSLQQKGAAVARTRTAAEAMRARSGAHSVQELTEAQQTERKEHMERLQNLVSQWQYLRMRHQKRHPYLYLDEQRLDRKGSKQGNKTVWNSMASANEDR